MTVSRGPLEPDTFGARAPIPPRVVLPVCFDPSHYSKRVRIANVVWRVEGAFISYKALIYPWCPYFRSMPVCHHFFSGSKKRCLTDLEEDSRKNSQPPQARRNAFLLLYCGHSAARSNFEIRGGNLGNSHPFRCVLQFPSGDNLL